MKELEHLKNILKYEYTGENSEQHNDDTLVQLPPDPHITVPSNSEIEEELVTPYNLTEDDCQAFCRDGFIKLPNVLSCGAVARLRTELLKLLYKKFAYQNISLLFFYFL